VESKCCKPLHAKEKKLRGKNISKLPSKKELAKTHGQRTTDLGGGKNWVGTKVKRGSWKGRITRAED